MTIQDVLDEGARRWTFRWRSPADHAEYELTRFLNWIRERVQGPAAHPGHQRAEAASGGGEGPQQEKEGAVTGAAQGQETRAPAEAT